jgi:hypothetical protein
MSAKSDRALSTGRSRGEQDAVRSAEHGASAQQVLPADQRTVAASNSSPVAVPRNPFTPGFLGAVTNRLPLACILHHASAAITDFAAATMAVGGQNLSAAS